MLGAQTARAQSEGFAAGGGQGSGGGGGGGRRETEIANSESHCGRAMLRMHTCSLGSGDPPEDF